jgi:RNA-directed DNA polymerase
LRLQDGFDFLGQNVCRFGTTLLLKPSRKNEQRFLAKVDDLIRQQGGHLTAGEMIERLNPLIRGWAQYHRHVSNNRRLARMDRLILNKLWRWARRRHRHKSAAWVKAKYFAHPGGSGERFRGTVAGQAGGRRPVWLAQAGATRIRRHVKVRGEANPYEPAWELYFEERLAAQMASTLAGRGTTRYLWLEQRGRCLVCGQPLTPEAGWHMHHLLWRSHGGDHDVDNLVLLHPNCHRQPYSEGLVVNKAASREGRS